MIIFYSTITTIQFGIEIITFYDKSSFLKIIGHAFRADSVCSFIIKSFHILIIKIFSFSSGLKSYWNIAEVQRVQQTMWQELIQTDRKGEKYVHTNDHINPEADKKIKIKFLDLGSSFLPTLFYWERELSIIHQVTKMMGTWYLNDSKLHQKRKNIGIPFLTWSSM